MLRTCDASRMPGSNQRDETSFMIVEDHPVVAFALKHLIESQPSWRVTTAVASVREGITALSTRAPDVAVVDLILPSNSGFEFLSWVRSHHPEVRTVIYSTHPDHVYAQRCLGCGASGYVGKSAPVEALIETLRWVIAGHVSINGQVLEEPLRHSIAPAPPGLDHLSLRELEVLSLLGQGLSNRRIAELMCRSDKTVESHRYRIARKLGIANGPQLVHFAIQHSMAAEAVEAAGRAGASSVAAGSEGAQA